jgi:hypothetical protein
VAPSGRGRSRRRRKALRPDRVDQATVGVDVSGMLLAFLIIGVAGGCAWQHLVLPMCTAAGLAFAILSLSVMIYRPGDDE